MTEIIPAIIPESLEHLRTKIMFLSGLADTVQLDIVDGIYVGNRSWPMNKSDRREFEKIVDGDEGLPFWEEFNFEVDLMVDSPETILEDWVKAGISRAVFHIESNHDFSKIKEAVNSLVEIGVAIENKTPIEKLEQYMPDINYVQVMGVEEIGKQGEQFSQNTIETVENIKEKYPNVTIQIDGGVDDYSAPLLVKAGADRLVSGSYILRSENPQKAIEKLKNE